jgi:G3E family GTPase
VTNEPARAINVSSASDPLAETSEEFLELSNGCLCCSIKDSGVAAIEKLMQRKGAFDYILLETTGLADPGTSSYTGTRSKRLTALYTKVPSRRYFGAMKNSAVERVEISCWTV